MRSSSVASASTGIAPKVVTWAKLCKERESVAKVLHDPDKMFEFIQFLQSKLGPRNYGRSWARHEA
jgi:hypothetical protein